MHTQQTAGKQQSPIRHSRVLSDTSRTQQRQQYNPYMNNSTPKDTIMSNYPTQNPFLVSSPHHHQQNYPQQSYGNQQEQFNTGISIEKRLEGTLRDVYNNIYNDHLIDTMRQDPTSQEFISLRVKELISECLNSEKELYISRLNQQNLFLRDEMQRNEHSYQLEAEELTDKISQLNSKLREKEEDCSMEKRKSAVQEDEIMQLNREISHYQRQYDDNMRQRDSERSKEINEALIEISSLKKVIEEYSIQMQIKDESILNQKEDLILALKDQDDYKDMIQKLELEKKALELDMESTLDQLSSSERQAEELLEINEELKRQYDHKSMQSDEGMINKIELDKQIQSLKDQLALLKSETEQKMAAEKNRFKETSEQLVEKSKSKINKIKEKNQKLKQQVTQLQEVNKSHINDQNSERKAFDKKVQGFEEKIQEIHELNEQEIDKIKLNHSEEIMHLQKEIQSMKENIESNSDQLAQKQQSLGRLQGKIEELENERKLLQNDYKGMIEGKEELVEELRKRIIISEENLKREVVGKNELAEELAQLKNNISDLEEQIQLKDQEYQALQQQGFDLQQLSENQAKLIEEMEKKTEQLEKQLSVTQDLVNEVKGDRNLSEEGRKQMGEKIRDLESQIIQHKEAVQQSHSNIEEKEKEILELQQIVQQQTCEREQLHCQLLESQKFQIEKDEEIKNLNEKLINRFEGYELEKSKKEEAFQQLSIVEGKMFKQQEDIEHYLQKINICQSEIENYQNVSQQRLIEAETYKTKLETQEQQFSQKNRQQQELKMQQTLYQKKLCLHMNTILQALKLEKQQLRKNVLSYKSQMQNHMQECFSELVSYFQYLYGQIMKLTGIEKETIEKEMEKKLEEITQSFMIKEKELAIDWQGQVEQEQRKGKYDVQTFHDKIQVLQDQNKKFESALKHQKEEFALYEEGNKQIIANLKKNHQVEIDNLLKQVGDEKLKKERTKQKYLQKQHENEKQLTVERQQMEDKYEKELYFMKQRVSKSEDAEREFMKTTQSTLQQMEQLERQYQNQEVEKSGIQNRLESRVNHLETMLEHQHHQRSSTELELQRTLQEQIERDLESHKRYSEPFLTTDLEKLKKEIEEQKRKLINSKNQILLHSNTNYNICDNNNSNNVTVGFRNSPMLLTSPIPSRSQNKSANRSGILKSPSSFNQSSTTPFSATTGSFNRNKKL